MGAQHIDAGLPVGVPIVGQTCHGVHARQPDGRLLSTELRGDCCESFVEYSSPIMQGVGFGDFLSSVGHHQRDECASSCDRGEDELEYRHAVMERESVPPESGPTQPCPRNHTECCQAEQGDYETHRERRTDVPQVRLAGSFSLV